MRKMSMEELHAYCLLRGSQLSPDDKKRVILESDASLEGKLTVKRVTEAIRLLGANFFQEMTGQKKGIRTKVYDQTAFTMEDETTEEAHVAQATEDGEVSEEMLFVLMQEGDEDAVFVSEYESAVTDVVQEDGDLAAAFNMYEDARRRLTEKARNRGFWPTTRSQSSFQSSFKGKGKGKSKALGNRRRSLQEKILNSHCRICHKKGDWKAECPLRGQNAGSSMAPSTGTATSTASTMTAIPEALNVQPEPMNQTQIGLPLEFVQLPEMKPLDVTWIPECAILFHENILASNPRHESTGRFGSGRLVRLGKQATEAAMRSDSHAQSLFRMIVLKNQRTSEASLPGRTEITKPTEPQLPVVLQQMEQQVLFATHGTHGIVDLGASKTVIGSNLVADFLKSLNSEIKEKVNRCSCQIVFRFGNQQTLSSQFAMVVPIGDLLLKIAVVPGNTPLLLSNSLMRALRASIDCDQHRLKSPLFPRSIPLQLTSKGLFLLDINELVECTQPVKFMPSSATNPSIPTETFVSETEPKEPTSSEAENPSEGPIQAEKMCDSVSKNQQVHCSIDSQASDKSPTRVQSLIGQIETKIQMQKQQTIPSASSSQAVNCRRSSSDLEHHQGAQSQSETPPSSGHPQDRDTEPSKRGSVLSDAPRFGAGGDPVRPSPKGQDIQGSVGHRPGVGFIHGQQVQPKSQASASALHEVCRDEAGPAGEEPRQADTALSGKSAEGQECTTPAYLKSSKSTRIVREPLRSKWSHIFARSRDSRSISLGSRDQRREFTRVRTADYGNASNGGDCVGSGSHSESHGQPRDCSPTSDSAPREPSGSRKSSMSSEAFPCDSCLSDPCLIHEDATEETKDMRHLRKLIVLMEAELQSVCHETKRKNQTVVLGEVFCGPLSQLTHQVKQLHGKAFRFGREQGDLSTSDGRKDLFRMLVESQPLNLWFSPECGPWSSWSQLNASRSIEHWDQNHELKRSLLYQIALGIVLYRFQLEKGNHFHWEQPSKSTMLSSPMLAEVHQHTKVCVFDMCQVGELKDPQNKQPMRKRMNVLTTSEEVYQNLHGQLCRHQHEHQPIEGTTQTEQGTLLRSKYTENYPRKFARRVAKIMCVGMKSKPFAWDDSVYAAETREQPLAKRRKLPDPPQRSEIFEPEVQNAEGVPKRRRLEGKQQPNVCLETCKQIINRVNQELPRVGRREITDPELLKQIQQVLGPNQVVQVIACRGTDRTLAPPKGLNAEEAPLRRTLLLNRTTGTIQIEKHWENWSKLAQRQLVRKAHPCKINITAFGSNQIARPSSVPPVSQSSECTEPKPREPSSRPLAEQSLPVPDGQMTRPDSEEPQTEPSECSKGVEQSVRVKSLSKQEQALLHKLHKNLGHPPNNRLSQALQASGHRAEMVQAALELKCGACEKCAPPRHQRPASLRPYLDFNSRIYLDGIQWTNRQGKTFHLYHMLDAGSNYHVAIVAPNHTTEKLIELLEKHWFSWAGPPEEMVFDAATEMNSEKFQEFAKQRNIRCTTIAPEAHWQNGKIERHGGFLQEMLKRVDMEESIVDYESLQAALNQCTRAKNTLSIRHGFSPEMIVFGKQTRIPGSILGDESIPSHEAALEAPENETESSRKFKRMLKLREVACRAYHSADNCEALRRAVNRRSHPHRGFHPPGSWVMIWRSNISGGSWIGPMKVIIQEGNHTIWTTQAGKLYRSAPEHVRNTDANSETDEIDDRENQNPLQQIADRIQITPEENQETLPENPTEITPNEDPERNSNESANSPNTLSQPDHEPENPSRQITPMPLPEVATEEEGATEEIMQLLSLDDEEEIALLTESEHLAWRYEMECNLDKPLTEYQPSHEEAMIFLATNSKKQRSEVKLSTLTPEEVKQFQVAKQKEVDNWISTGTIEKIMRDKVPASQILRCRWILTWKEIDDPEKKTNELKIQRAKKAKARLVVLGFLDPAIEDIPRDSPTLNKTSKMLILQTIATMGWNLMSFDIRAAFLQGKPQSDRVLAIEPVPELRETMQMKDQEVCKLNKGAYGLIDAPFQWFCALREELERLQFVPSPFDPCCFILRNPEEEREKLGEVAGILGIHVDDGLGGGNEFYKQQLRVLEEKYPFGEKKMSAFTFTGIEMKQSADKSINLSQSQYIRKIEPIKIDINRKTQEEANVTEPERLQLRGLVGSLQYASVHTRPDLASKLSFLQSDINKAKISTLIEANKLLHEAKKHHDVSITIKPIPLKEFRFMAFSDASFASQSKPDSHAGTFIVGTNQAIQEGIQSPISPISWGCKKIQKVVTSTLAAETTSLASALDQLGWLRLFWSWIFNGSTKWKNPEETLKRIEPAISVPTLKHDLAVTDCKSLYDLATRTATPSCSEFRVQLMARAIKETLNEGILLRWVHSGAQLADALTKAMEASFLRETLRIGCYRLSDEESILKARSKARDRVRWLKSQTEKQYFFWECEFPLV